MFPYRFWINSRIGIFIFIFFPITWNQKYFLKKMSYEETLGGEIFRCDGYMRYPLQKFLVQSRIF